MAELQIKKQDADTRSMVAKGKMMVDAAKLQQNVASLILYNIINDF